MTNENDDLTARFRLDQEAATEEERTREQVQWDLAVAASQADIGMKNAHTRHTEARAALWDALQNLVWVIVAALVIVGLVSGVQHVIGWFR